MAGISTREVLDVYPLTTGQQGILVEALGSSGPPLYLQHYVVELAGVPDAATLREGFATLCDQHDVLRTGFVWDVAEQPLQVVRARAEIPLTVEDMRDAGGDTVARRAAQLLAEERSTPFDLSLPPLLRVRALRVADRAWQMVMTHHHLIMDGWSVPLLHRRLAEILAARQGGAGAEVTARRSPAFGEFVSWQRAVRRRDGDATYFTELLGDVTRPAPLGGDLPRHLVRLAPAGAEHARAPGASTPVTALHRVSGPGHPDRAARLSGLLPSTVVHAAWALLLARWSGVSDVVFGSTVSGRPAELPEVTERIGMFVNTAVLRIRVPPTARLGEWLHAVQRCLGQAREHEQASIAAAQRCASLPPGTPLLSSVLAFHNQARLDGSGIAVGAIRLRVLAHAERTGLPLAISVALPADGVWVSLSHDASRVGSTEARWIAQTLARLIADLAVLPGNTPLAGIPVIPSPAARPRPEAAFDHLYSSVMSRLTAIGDPAPGNPAVADANRSASAPSLLSAAAETARRLRLAAPHVAGQAVMVHAPSGIGLVTAILAALMCRAAPVAVDPYLPAQELPARLGNKPVLRMPGASLPCGVLGPTVEIAGLPDRPPAGPPAAGPPAAAFPGGAHRHLQGLAFGVQLARDCLELGSQDRVLSVLAADDALTPTVILAALAAGSHLDLREPTDPTDPADPPDPAEQAEQADPAGPAPGGATVLIAAPAAAAELAERTAPGARVVVAGDPPAPNLVAKVAASGRAPWRLWASGRTGGADACAKLTGPDDALRLGRVLGGRVVDESGAPVAPGRSGELELVLADGALRAGITVMQPDVALPGDGAGEITCVQLGRSAHDELLVTEQMLGSDDSIAAAAVTSDADGGVHAWLASAGADATPVMEKARRRMDLLPERCRPAGYTVLHTLPSGRDGGVHRDALAEALALGTRRTPPPTPSPLAARLAGLPVHVREDFLRRLRTLAGRSPGLRHAHRDTPEYSIQQREWQAQTSPARDRVRLILPARNGPGREAIARSAAAYGLPATAVRWTSHNDSVLLDADPGSLDVPALALIAERAREAMPAVAGLAEPGLTYADYAAWQTSAPRAAIRAEHVSHWNSVLAGVMPAKWPPPVRCPAADVVEDPAGLAIRLPVTAAGTAWVAAAATALALLAGCEEVVVGVVTRPDLPAEADTIAGPFSRTLPLRLAVRPGQPFAATQAAVAAALRAGRAHADASWAELAELLGGILPVSIAVHKQPDALSAHGDVAIGLDVAQTRERAAAAEKPGQTTKVTAIWAPGRARRKDAERLRDLTVAALRRGLADGNSPLRAADLLTSAARRELLQACDGGPPDPVIAATIPEAIRAWSQRAPDAVAVEAADCALSYAELARLADRFAQRLRAEGIREGDHVALFLPRLACLVWAMLGIMTAGASYVPLNVTDPDDRLHRMLADCAARAVVTTAELAARFAGEKVLAIDAPSEMPGPPAAAGPPPAAAGPAAPFSRSCAYVIYTSGSTGEPKGVMVEHFSVVTFAQHIARAYQVGPGTRLLAFAPPAFDVSVFEFWAGLSAGATIVLASDEERLSADALQKLLERGRVTVAELPPSVLPLLRPDRLPELRLVSVGGEAPAGALVDEWATDAREFWNGYGPTETTVAVTLMRCAPPSRGRVPPIGRPMPGHRAYVLDGELRMVPPGVTGELCVSGPGLARGYLGAAGATASCFVPDPYGDPGARMYRTGDLARWTAEGVLEFAGRSDSQIKIRGFRVEPAEVEAALADDPAVSQAVVAPWDAPGGTRHLVAYLVWADPADPLDLVRLRDRAARRLAPYMLPTRLVTMERLPLTATGKVDRERLPDPADVPADSLVPDTSTWSETERALAHEVIGPLVGRAAVRRDQGFFHLGGDSLQAMQVTARVRDRFGAEISLLDFFRDPTVAGLAKLIDASQAEASQAGASQADGAPTGSAPHGRRVATAAYQAYTMMTGAKVPLSYPQAALYAAYRALGDRAVYHAPLALRVRGELDLGALRTSFGWLMSRHAAIRVTVADGAGGPVQLVHPAAEPPVEVGGIRAGEPGDHDGLLRRAVSEEAARPFDLGRELPFRVRLHKIGPGDHLLQWTFHHFAIDGWSMGVMARELSHAYNAFTAGGTPTLAPLASDYGEFVSWHQDYVNGPAFRSDLEWWRGYLAGAGENPGFGRLAAGDRQEFRHGWLNLQLPQETAAAVGELTRARGITLYMVCLAAQAIALGGETGSDDLLIVTPHSLRIRSEWERLVGWFVNRVVVRVRLDGRLSFAELAGSVRQTCANVFAHGSAPFELLRAELGLPGPALPAQLSVQNAPTGGVDFRGLATEVVSDDSGRDFAPLLEVYSPIGAWFRLSVMLRERPDGRIAGGLEYDAALVSRETAQRWHAAFLGVLAAAARAPGTRVAELAQMARDPRRLTPHPAS